MSMPTIRALVLMLAIMPAAAVYGSPEQSQQPAQDQQDEATVADVVVVTASRREEQLLNAPATMTVLTDDVIGKAPVQSVTDLLRLVPGLNTVQSSVRDVNVTSREATGTLADSMLVLLDGRSIYQDFFGFVAWDFLPIDVQEIKQIEVIRGPASAVWGANAMTGVINVITRTPREMQGSRLAIRFGQFDRSGSDGRFDGGGIFSISATHAAATSERFAYKVSAGFLTQEPFPRPTGNVPGTTTPYPGFENRGTTQPRLDARADYELEDRRGKVILAGGIAGTEGIVHTGLGPLDVRRGTTFKYGRITYARERLKLQVFVNALDGESPPMLQTGLDGGPLDFRFENQAYDVEFSDLRIPGARHVVSYGGNYRHNNFNLSFAPRGSNRDEGGAYVQDQIVLSERYRWIVGGRVDRFDVLTKSVFSPHTTLLIKPRANQTVRLSFNRAFRAPSFVNSFFDITLLTPGAGGAFPHVAEGNQQLRAESLTAYEVGYIGRFGRTTVGAAAYLNRTRDMIQFTQIGTGLPVKSTYQNFHRTSYHGLELSADGQITAGVSAFANYTWQADPTPVGFDIKELNLPPTHRFNTGAAMTHGRYFGSVSGSFVDAEYWQDVLDARYHGETKAHTLIDGAIGVHSADGVITVAVRGTNLLNRPVQQHVFGDVIRRTVTGEVRLEF
jgi:iron complex outermembrane receptor protein